MLIGKRHAGFFNECPDLIVGLGVGCALAKNDQRALGALEYIKRAFDCLRRWNLRRRRVDDLNQRFGARLGIHHLGEQFCGEIEIDAARPARYCGADSARHADPDIGRMQHAEGGLAQGLGHCELIHFFIVALLQIDDLALGRARNQDHREAIGRGMGERGQPVEKSWRRNGEADARRLGQKAVYRRGIARVLLVPE